MTEDLLTNFVSIDKRQASITGLLAQLVECGADNTKVMSSSLIQTMHFCCFCIQFFAYTSPIYYTISVYHDNFAIYVAMYVCICIHAN